MNQDPLVIEHAEQRLLLVGDGLEFLKFLAIGDQLFAILQVISKCTQTREDFGLETVSCPECFVPFIDHMVPVTSPKEEELHKITRAWGKKQGVPVYEREGFGRQVSAELGYATPGAFAVHFDGHVSQLGAFGTFVFGARKGVVEAFTTEDIILTVPATVKVELTGMLQAGVMAHDVFHHMVYVWGRLTADSRRWSRAAR